MKSTKIGQRRDMQPPTAELFRRMVEGVRDYAIFALDRDGFIRTWNPGAEQLKGYRAEEIIGEHFSRFYPAEAIARDWPATELKLAGEYGRFEDEGYRVRKDGTLFWANVVITALRDDDGSLLGYSKITRDLTARRTEEEALRRSEERFRLLVESVVDYAIFMLDDKGYVTSWNAGAERIKGYKASEIIGKHFSIFYPQEALDRNWPAIELERAAADGRFEDEGYRLRNDGTPIWANVIITALYERDGSLRGFAKVTRDLTERRRVQTLESDARRTNEFIAMLGHELRNPLAPIRNAVGILTVKPDHPATVSWSASVIERQTAHLGKLVDDLLDVSRITRGAITIDRECVRLDDVILRAAEATAPQLEQRNQSLVKRVKPGVVVVGDTVRLGQIVTNLVQNASKFTPDGGRIEVELRADDDCIRLFVRDNGIGMTPDLAARVFDLFTQGDRTVEQREGGLGLGLTIVERLAGLHGGQVRARSDGPGLGSEFVIELPPAPADATWRAEPASEPEAGRLRILVVDDNVDSADSMAMLLRLEGHGVDVLHHGGQVVERLRACDYDVAILDIKLPGRSGYELAREVRAMPELAGLYLVAMTGFGTRTDREDALAAGFDEHFPKPVKLDSLANALNGRARRTASS